MDEVTITRHGGGKAGEYRAHVAGSPHIGRLSWVQHGAVRAAEHTVVPKAIGGRGIAARLVEALIADARAEHFRVDPVCSYVAAAFDKRPEWTPLRA